MRPRAQPDVWSLVQQTRKRKKTTGKDTAEFIREDCRITHCDSATGY
jgi:hypothetical protein